MEYNYTHLKEYKRPTSYMGPDYYGYAAVVGRHRDSDSLDNSNYEAILADLTEQYPDALENKDLLYIRDSHWLVGWVENLYVRLGTEIADICDDILAKLDDYPVYNDDHFSNLEYSEFEETFENNKSWFISDLTRYLDNLGYMWTDGDFPDETEEKIMLDIIHQAYDKSGEESGFENAWFDSDSLHEHWQGLSFDLPLHPIVAFLEVPMQIASIKRDIEQTIQNAKYRLRQYKNNRTAMVQCVDSTTWQNIASCAKDNKSIFRKMNQTKRTLRRQLAEIGQE